MPTLSVGRPEGEPWAIVLDGETVETFRAHYDADEVLLRAETYVDGDVTWRLTDDGGFEAVWATSTVETFRQALIDHFRGSESQMLGLPPKSGDLVNAWCDIIADFELED